ncbi:diaminopimelate epimerase [Bacillus sp. JCM 19041]|uniref:diaminopimelate epimerase n=1 Tax=Bacillus sp. JCM 19041 TaxID=1460637 RepID=UPI00336A4161
MEFTKMHGLGNSYIYINLFKETLPEERMAETAIRVADPNRGIGGDGMILIAPSDSCAVKMRVFNSDGSEAKNCGNGLRCVAKYSYEQGIVDQETFTIETLGGPVSATVYPNDSNIVETVSVNMGKPRLEPAAIPMTGIAEDRVINKPIKAGDGTVNITAISMGNPHAVMFVDAIDHAPVTELGPLIEKHSVFPEWVNAEWVEVLSQTELNFRVWERGSGITQACGTGACAAAVASVLNGYSNRGEPVTVHLLGGDLEINWQENGDVLMNGPAEYICTGKVYV